MQTTNADDIGLLVKNAVFKGISLRNLIRHVASICVPPFDKSKPAVIKVILIGPSAAGKTALVTRYVKDAFSEYGVLSVAAAFRSVDVIFNDKTARLEIWDTAGVAKYHSLLSLYFHGATVVIFVFDISRRDDLRDSCETSMD